MSRSALVFLLISGLGFRSGAMLEPTGSLDGVNSSSSSSFVSKGVACEYLAAVSAITSAKIASISSLASNNASGSSKISGISLALATKGDA